MPELQEIHDWFKNVLKSPRHVVSPMVDASELPWRMLSRKYKADLCYTPMLHSRCFVENSRYREDNLFNCVSTLDRPLIVQFCGNDPNILVEAAKIAKDYCDGVDINLGCPQKIAKNGHYGAFLQNEWELISEIVKRINDEVKIPVTCKIRVFPDIQKTIEYAKCIEKSGAWLLTVHGRTIDQKGMNTGLASWAHIKAVREAIKIPMFANGNIQYFEDVGKCIEETGVDGCMSAEGSLHNPCIFSGLTPLVWDIALEYLEFVKIYPCPISYSRGHIFKIFHHMLQLKENFDLRMDLANAITIESFEEISLQIKNRFELIAKGEKEWEIPDQVSKLPLSPWIVQPYVRPEPIELNIPKPDKKLNRIEQLQTSGVNLDPELISQLSKNKLKQLEKSIRKGKNFGTLIDSFKRNLSNPTMCENKEKCSHTRGSKCDHKFCKICCQAYCIQKTVNCTGHKIFRQNNRNEKYDKDRSIVESV